jgi:hypothetical protein
MCLKGAFMGGAEPVLIIDNDALVITGAEPEQTTRPYSRVELLALCHNAYILCSQLPYNPNNFFTQEHIFACWHYLKNGHPFAVLSEDPDTGIRVDDDDHIWVRITTSTAQEMRRERMVSYELFFIPSEEALARSKGDPDT